MRASALATHPRSAAEVGPSCRALTRGRLPVYDACRVRGQPNGGDSDYAGSAYCPAASFRRAGPRVLDADAASVAGHSRRERQPGPVPQQLPSSLGVGRARVQRVVRGLNILPKALQEMESLLPSLPAGSAPYTSRRLSGVDVGLSTFAYDALDSVRDGSVRLVLFGYAVGAEGTLWPQNVGTYLPPGQIITIYF